MSNCYLFTYAPHIEDAKLFTLGRDSRSSLYDRLLEKLQEISEFCVVANEHPDSNSHWHGSGRLLSAHSGKNRDWLTRLLKPYFPKTKSIAKSFQMKHIPDSDILKSMAYCQKEHGENIYYFNISNEQKTLLDAINADVGERDNVTYNIIKSKDKFCCDVMRLCDTNIILRNMISLSLNNYGIGGQNVLRYDQIVRSLMQDISSHNLIFSGRWDTVVTTLYQMFSFRGWLNINNSQNPRDL